MTTVGLGPLALEVPFPDECVQGDGAGPVACVQTDSGWVPQGGGATAGPGADLSGFFGVLFLVVVVLGVVGVVVKVRAARQMAGEAGMDPDRATAMTLLTDDGLEATYLAASLRQAPTAVPVAPVPASGRSTSERLRELDDLRAQGLIDDEEHSAARRAVIDSV